MPEKSLKEIIVEVLKEQGLELAEDAAVLTVKAVLASLPKIVSATENKIDDMLIPLLGVVEPKIMELLDKIDGKDDPTLG